jgi:nucleotide-binding universal stress UspA family protein
MIKNILVALDASPGSISAQTLAIQLAETHKAALTGIGIVDEPWINSPEAIPLGGMAFVVERDEQLLIETKKHVLELEESFINSCKTKGLPHSIIDVMGVPADEIERCLVEYDLLVIGKDASFHFNNPTPPTSSVRQLIKDNPRPLIVTGKALPNQDKPNVLVTFDGTFSASRSLHMALLTGFLRKKTVHIVSVGPNEILLKEQIKAAAKLCQEHGVHPHLHPRVSENEASKILLEEIEKIHPSLLVLGAYSHGELNHFFWGSCAEELLQATDTPTFFFH